MRTQHNTEEKEKTPTETVTFRIEHDALIELREESKLKMESLNILINQILKFYIEWHRPSLKAGNIPFSKGLLARIFDILNDEQIDKMAQDYVKYEFKEQMRMLKRKVYSSILYRSILRLVRSIRFSLQI
jgi:hypothetical protein